MGAHRWPRAIFFYFGHSRKGHPLSHLAPVSLSNVTAIICLLSLASVLLSTHFTTHAPYFPASVPFLKLFSLLGVPFQFLLQNFSQP